MKLLIVLALVLIVSVAARRDRSQDWSKFKGKHGKKYRDDAQDGRRRAHFERNADRVDSHNERHAKGEVSYEQTLYEFSDQPVEDVIQALCRTERQETPTTRQLPNSYTDAQYPAATAASKDWTSSMQPIVDQQQCGSCWAFATIAQVEYLYKIKKNVNVQLSQQNVVSCSKTKGCSGGWPTSALQFVKASGTYLSSAWPYAATDGTCTTKAAKYTTVSNPVLNVAEFNLNGNEARMRNVIFKSGPVAVAIQVLSSFMNYKGGIYRDSTCPNTCKAVNHAVVVVGYGTDTVLKKDYWIVRNSWGPNWGEKGYIRMARDGTNNCNTACYAMFGY